MVKYGADTKDVGINNNFLAVYQDEHEAMPGSLDDLYPKYVSNREAFVSLMDEQPPTTPGGMPCSYVYAAPPPEADPFTIICHTRKGVYPDGHVALFMTLHVEWIAGPELVNPYLDGDSSVAPTRPPGLDTGSDGLPVPQDQ